MNAAPPQAGAPSGATLALVIIVSLNWGLNWPAMKVGLAETPAFQFRLICVLVGGLGLMALAAAGRHRLLPPRDEIGPTIIVALLCVVGWMQLSALSLTLVSAGRAAMIGFTMPLWTAAFSVLWLGERMTARRAGGLALGAGGVALLAWPALTDAAAGGGQALGVGFMAAAAICWAGGLVYVKRRRWTLGTTAFTAWQLLIAAPPIALGALIFEHDRPWLDGVTIAGALGVAYASVVSTFGGYWLYFRLVGMGSAALASMGILAVPVIGMAGGALLLGERYGPADLVGAALLMAGLASVVLPGRRAHPPPC